MMLKVPSAYVRHRLPHCRKRARGGAGAGAGNPGKAAEEPDEQDDDDADPNDLTAIAGIDVEV
jgi:hypothetical protein